MLEDARRGGAQSPASERSILGVASVAACSICREGAVAHSIRGAGRRGSTEPSDQSESLAPCVVPGSARRELQSFWQCRSEGHAPTCPFSSSSSAEGLDDHSHPASCLLSHQTCPLSRPVAWPETLFRQMVGRRPLWHRGGCAGCAQREGSPRAALKLWLCCGAASGRGRELSCRQKGLTMAQLAVLTEWR